MMKLPLALAALTLAAAPALAQNVVRLGSEGAYPPYNFINDANQLDGFERELGDALCERAQLTCEWVITDWDSIIPNLTAGNFDAILAGMNITDERRQVISFSDAYTPPAASSYAALEEDADIENGVVAVQVSTVQASYVAQTGATLLEFATPDETVAAVRNGEADAVFADRDFLVPIVEESGGEFVFVGEDVQLGEGIGIGLRQSDEELRETFNTAIASMKEDGTLNEMIIKWFGPNALTFD